MKRWEKIARSFLIFFLLIQFFRPARNSDSRLRATDISRVYKVSDHVLAVLRAACYDCHSNRTVYPWYSNIQPFGWLLASHIRHGKAELNFSEFGSYSARRKGTKLKGIINSIKDGTMPLWSYRLMHKKARLSKAERDQLIRWAEALEH